MSAFTATGDAVDLTTFPGPIGKLAAYLRQSGVGAELAFSTAVVIGSALAGRRFKSGIGGTRPNLFLAVIGADPEEVDFVNRLTDHTLRTAGLGDLLIECPFNYAGFAASMKRRPTGFMRVHGFGEAIRSTAKGTDRDFGKGLRRYYKYGNHVVSDIYHNLIIAEPTLSVLATDTDDAFSSAINDKVVIDRFNGDTVVRTLNRFIILRTRPAKTAIPRSRGLSQQVHEALVEFAVAVAGDLDPKVTPNRIAVPFDPDAMEILRTVVEARHERLVEKTFGGSVHAHAPQTAERLAMLRAISRDPVNPVVAAEDVNFAGNLTFYAAKTMEEQANAAHRKTTGHRVV